MRSAPSFVTISPQPSNQKKKINQSTFPQLYQHSAILRSPSRHTITKLAFCWLRCFPHAARRCMGPSLTDTTGIQAGGYRSCSMHTAVLLAITRTSLSELRSHVSNLSVDIDISKPALRIEPEVKVAPVGNACYGTQRCK